MVPTVEFPFGMPFTSQTSVGLVTPVTVAVSCVEAPSSSIDVCAATTTLAGGGGGGGGGPTPPPPPLPPPPPFEQPTATPSRSVAKIEKNVRRTASPPKAA